MKKHLSKCQNKVYKGIEIKSIVLENDPANYDCSKRFTYETTNLPSVPERNAANSRTFYSKNYFILFLSYTDTGSLDHTIRFYSYLYLIIYLRYFIPTFFRFSHVFTFVYKPQAEYFFLSLIMM